jgi:hypothetical protein
LVSSSVIHKMKIWGLSSSLAVDFAGSYAVGVGDTSEKKPPFEAQGKQGCADSALRYRALREQRIAGRDALKRAPTLGGWRRRLALGRGF